MAIGLKQTSNVDRIQVGVLVVLLLALLMMPHSAEARRALRIEFAGDWSEDQSDSPGADCPGVSNQNVSVVGPVRPTMGLDLNTVSFEVSGAYTTSSGATARIEQDYLLNAYCQDGPQLSNLSFADDEDPAMQEIVGENANRDVKGLRYTFTPSDSIFDEGALGFQWVFYTFPNNITLVRFRGLTGEGENISQTTIQVKQGGSVLFEDFSLLTTYNGEFLCFQNQTYLGVWDEQTFEFQNPLLGCQIPQEDEPETQQPTATPVASPPPIDPQVAARRVGGVLLLLLMDE